jgi:Phosphomannose isomerase type I
MHSSELISVVNARHSLYSNVYSMQHCLTSLTLLLQLRSRLLYRPAICLTLAATVTVYRMQVGDLPFMFKILSIGKALSIQAHPDKILVCTGNTTNYYNS